MSKKQKKSKKPKRKEEHPTMFVFEGSLRVFSEGSMLELHSQIRQDEWELIVEETVKYKCFVECLKDVACPKLDEVWTEDDDWFRVQLGVAVSRMRNLDALMVAQFNQETIKENYTKAMDISIKEVKVMIEQVRAEQKEILHKKYESDSVASVSDL